MYAVIKAGGKQYRVSPGQNVKIEQVQADVGATIEIADVLMVADGDKVKVGTPTVMRRRKHYQKTQGHRQNYTEIRVDAINQ